MDVGLIILDAFYYGSPDRFVPIETRPAMLRVVSAAALRAKLNTIERGSRDAFVRLWDAWHRVDEEV